MYKNIKGVIIISQS